jgi:hypothetical protein
MTFIHLAFVVDFVVNASLDLSSGSVAPVLEDFATTSYMCPKAGLGLVASRRESSRERRLARHETRNSISIGNFSCLHLTGLTCELVPRVYVASSSSLQSSEDLYFRFLSFYQAVQSLPQLSEPVFKPG